VVRVVQRQIDTARHLRAGTSTVRVQLQSTTAPRSKAVAEGAKVKRIRYLDVA